MNLHATSWQEITALTALGLAPSAVWLWYYLRQDVHPEPKMMVLKVFFLGFLSTFIAFGLEWVFIKTIADASSFCSSCGSVFAKFIGNLDSTGVVELSSFLILGVLAFIEEITKYTAAKVEVIKSKYFDEPTDAMIYLVVAALGFAAAENIGYVFQTHDVSYAIGTAFYRFVSATFLHALASAVMGYFLAISIIHKKHPLPYLSVGLLCATMLHTLFNFLIILSGENGQYILYIILFMITLFFFVSALFVRVHKLSFNIAADR